MVHNSTICLAVVAPSVILATVVVNDPDEAQEQPAGGDAPAARPPAPPPANSKRRWLLLLAAVVLLAFVVPRAMALRGIPLAVNLEFADQLFHQYHVDLLYKQAVLDDEHLSHPYFQAFPDMMRPVIPLRWPRTVYYVTVPFAALFGSYSIWTTQATNLLATLLLLTAVILLGRAMHSTQTGLWAALLTVLCPALVAASWYFSLDYPLIAMVTMALYLLWRTRGFTVPLATALFAVWAGLGMCIKMSFAIYLAGPALWVLVHGLIRGPRWRPPVFVVSATAITLGIITLLINPSWSEVWNEFHLHTVMRNLPAATIDPWTTEWLLCLVKFAALNYPWPLLLLAAPALVLLPLRRGQPGKWLMLAFVLGSMVLLTAMMNKLERYLQPLYPMVCLLTVWWIAVYVPRRIRGVAQAAVALIYAGMLVYVHLVNPTPWDQGNNADRANFHVYYEFEMPGKRRLDLLRKHTFHTRHQLKPHIDRIVALARQDKKRQPLGICYLKDPKQMILDFPIGEVVVPVAHQLTDRMVVSYLFGVNGLPPGMLNAPLLVVVHPVGLDPEQVHHEIKVLKKWTATLVSGAGAGDYTFSVAQPKHVLWPQPPGPGGGPPPPGDAPPPPPAPPAKPAPADPPAKANTL